MIHRVVCLRSAKVFNSFSISKYPVKYDIVRGLVFFFGLKVKEKGRIGFLRGADKCTVCVFLVAMKTEPSTEPAYRTGRRGNRRCHEILKPVTKITFCL